MPNIGVIYELGKGMPKGKDLVKAAHWFERAASKGNSFAQLNLGVCYMYGRGVDKDPSKAFIWFQKSANQGNKQAQFDLAVLYHTGQGGVKDEQTAQKWFALSKANMGELSLVKATSEKQ